MSPARGRRPRGPTDSERASRIANATIQVLGRTGIAGLTHRAVAAQAAVPLGSTTYHYASRHDLLAAAILKSIMDNEAEIRDWAEGLNRDNLVEKLATLLEVSTAPGAARERTLVEWELYLAAARDENLRALSRRWDGVLRGALKERVGNKAARAYFALYQGLLVESLTKEEALEHDDLRKILNAIVVD